MNTMELREYLLGRLSPEQRATIETRMFEENEFDSLLQEAEADLLDDWARGRLSTADSMLVRARFPRSKLDLARELARHVGARSNRLRWIWTGAAAALLFAAIGTGYLTWPPAPPPVETTQVIALSAPSTRGGTVPVFRIDPSKAALRITAPAPAGFPSFELRLESGAPPVQKEVSPESGSVSIEVPAGSIPDGSCDLLIFGRVPGSDPELIVTYPFQAVRR